jgi:hypothetical protein
MNSQSKEVSQFNSLNPHKYSLRQQYLNHKLSKKGLYTPGATLRGMEKQIYPVQTQSGFVPLGLNFLSKEDRKDSSYSNCYQNGSLTLDMNRRTQVTYPDSYQTASTNHTAEIHGVYPLKFDQKHHRIDG